MTFSKGLTAAASDAVTFRTFVGNLWDNFVVSGFAVTDNGGLSVSIAAGYAAIKNSSGEMYHVISDGAQTLTCTANSINYIYLHCDNGSDWITKSSSSTLPSDAIILATVTTTADDITRIIDARPQQTHKEVHNIQYTRIENVDYNIAETLNFYFHVTEPIYVIGVYWKNPFWGSTPTDYATYSNTTSVYYNIGSGDDVMISTGDTTTWKYIPMSLKLESADAYIKVAGWITDIYILYKYATD
jgi:hypothetical protein